MIQRNFQPKQWLLAAQNALKPSFLVTMALTVIGTVLIYSLFDVESDQNTFGVILSRFIATVSCGLWILFGLTALAHQLHCQVQEKDLPNTIEAFRFAAEKAKSLLMLPTWGAGILLALLLVEMLLLSLANFPGLGLVWLALIAVPLLLLNTVVAVALLLAVFNIAARVAVSDVDSNSLKNDLWMLLKQRLPELLIYNLGGVLVTAFVAILVLSPLWLGAHATMSLMDYAAHEALIRAMNATGFWGSIAHLVGLIMLAMLLAAVVSVPCVAITHMTLLMHLEFIAEQLTTTIATEPSTTEEPENS